MYIKFWSEHLKGRDHLEDLAVKGRIIPEWKLRETGSEVVDWNHLVQNKEK
jgi:hypothetical protein